MTEIEEMQAELGRIDEKLGKGFRFNLFAYSNRFMAMISAAYPSQETMSGAGEGTDWRLAIAAVEAEFDRRQETRVARTTEAMALAIIRLTYGHGECTDAMLRAEFDARDVERLSGAAVERANVMADRGPFSVTVAGGANDGGTK